MALTFKKNRWAAIGKVAHGKKITMGEADFLVSEEVRQAGRILNLLL
jgi:hypothetical protein